MKKLKNNLCILSILFLLEIFCISYAPAHATNTEDTEGSIQQSPHSGGGYVEVQDSPRKPQSGSTATETWVGSNSAPIEISPEEQEAANKAWEKYLEENYNVRHYGDSQETYYLSKNGRECLLNNGERGEVNGKYTFEAGIPGETTGGKGGQLSCQKTDHKPGEQNNAKAELYARQIAEIQAKYESMTPAAPQLRLNDYPSPHVWKDENAHFYVEYDKSNTYDGELLAGHVQIETVPVMFDFETGDGHRFTTTNPSKKLHLNSTEQMPRTLTGHEYKESGNYHAYVTVTYTGRYRINNGPWRPLRGQLTRTSEAALVRVWEIETHNVAKLCNEDPTAWACPGSKHRPDYNNPNPRLAVPDPHTGQQWHKDNVGSGDTEWWRKPAKKQTGSH